MRHELEKQGHEKCQSRKKLRLAALGYSLRYLDGVRIGRTIFRVIIWKK